MTRISFNLRREHLQSIASSVAEEVEAATWGYGSWRDVCERLSGAFPGSSCLIFGEDPVDQRVNYCTAINIDQKQIDAYSNYFAFRNPWIDIFRHRTGDYCAVSERDYPSRLLGKTEFYNDFIMKIPNFTASTGISLNLDTSLTFRFPLHYAIAQAPQYDAAAEIVMKQLVGPIKRSVHAVQRLQSITEGQLAIAALIERRNALSFVIDAAMKLQEANEDAAKAFSRGDFLLARQNKVSFADPVLTRMVSARVRDLAANVASEVSTMAHRNDAGHWLISFSRLPVLRLNPLLAGRALILVQIRNLRPDRQPPPDLHEFSRLFRLTPAEEKLCAQLAQGYTLTEAATSLGIKVETARDRIKTIFDKTALRRQADLVALLQRSL